MDDIICVTLGSIEDHEREVREVLTKLQNAGYRPSERKTELFKKEPTWLGYYINQEGLQPIKDETKAVTELKAILPGLHSTSLEVHKQSLKEGR